MATMPEWSWISVFFPLIFRYYLHLKNVEEEALADCTGYLPPPDNTATIHLAVVHTSGDETAGQQLSCTAAPGETAVVGGAAADPQLPEARGGGEEAQFELFDSDAENVPDMGSGEEIFFTVLSGSGAFFDPGIRDRFSRILDLGFSGKKYFNSL